MKTEKVKLTVKDVRNAVEKTKRSCAYSINRNKNKVAESQNLEDEINKMFGQWFEAD